MKFFIRAFLALLIAVSLSIPLPAFAQNTPEEPVYDHLQGWEIQKGDWGVANVAENTLQLVRADNSAISAKVRIGSGKTLPDGKKFAYLGMVYDPRTPAKVWEVKSKQQQRWYNVFGSKEAKEQLFLRLYEVKGDKRIWSHYGIHTTPEIDTIIDRDGGFGSWGCILARYDLLKQLEALYQLNDETLRLVTTTQDTAEIIALLKAF